jgi:hypothetical protein
MHAFQGVSAHWDHDQTIEQLIESHKEDEGKKPPRQVRIVRKGCEPLPLRPFECLQVRAQFGSDQMLLSTFLHLSTKAWSATDLPSSCSRTRPSEAVPKSRCNHPPCQLHVITTKCFKVFLLPAMQSSISVSVPCPFLPDIPSQCALFPSFPRNPDYPTDVCKGDILLLSYLTLFCLPSQKVSL